MLLWSGLSAFAADPAAAELNSRPAVPSPLDAQPGIVRVYENSFAKAPGDEWSHRSVSQTPQGNHRYLGTFTAERVELALTDLPPHKLLRISFDLYLMKSWDGSSPYWGVKIWDMGVVGGQNLIHSTFGNCGFFTDNNIQSFPETYPCRDYPAWTGATEKQTLGVIQSWGGPQRTFDTSSWYRMSLPFPHTAPSVTLSFEPTPKQGAKDWGIGNVRVEAIPELLKLNEQELTDRFIRLGANDPTDAFKTLWELVAAGDDAVAYLAQRWKQTAEPTDTQLRNWTSQCAGDDLALANQASWSLMTSGLAAYPHLSAQLEAGGLSAAAQERCQEARSWIDLYPETATELRQHRIHHLLEAIGTPAALKLLAQVPAHPARDRSAIPATPPVETQPAPEGSIQLDVRNERAEAVFAALSKQTGIHLDVSGPGIWDTAQPITMQMRNGRFWPTLLEACRQAGLAFERMPSPNGFTVRLTSRNPDSISPARFPCAQSNGFLILATAASRNRSLNYARPDARQQSQMLTLTLLNDPAANVAQISPLAIAQATDSKGADVLGGARWMAMPSGNTGPGAGTGAGITTLVSNAPSEGPQALAHLQVGCSATLVTGMEHLDIPEPLKAESIRRSLALFDLLVQPLAERSRDGRTEYTLRFTFGLKQPPTPQGRTTTPPSTLAESATLADANGHRYTRINIDNSGGNLIREQVVRFTNPDPATIGQPATLSIDLPAATREIPLTFDLENLTLP